MIFPISGGLCVELCSKRTSSALPSPEIEVNTGGRGTGLRNIGLAGESAAAAASSAA